MNRTSALIPPDKERCQAMRVGGSFMTFGPRPMIRCDNKPVVIIKENKKDEDGLRGSMSVCGGCLKTAKKKLGPKYFTITKI